MLTEQHFWKQSYLAARVGIISMNNCGGPSGCDADEIFAAAKTKEKAFFVFGFKWKERRDCTILNVFQHQIGCAKR